MFMRACRSNAMRSFSHNLFDRRCLRFTAKTAQGGANDSRSPSQRHIMPYEIIGKYRHKQSRSSDDNLVVDSLFTDMLMPSFIAVVACRWDPRVIAT